MEDQNTHETSDKQAVKPAAPNKLMSQIAEAAIVTALLIANWIAYTHREKPQVDASTLSPSDVAALPTPSAPSKATPASIAHTNRQTAANGAADAKAATSEFKRVRVSPNEVDYVADDVTIRHFLPDTLTPRIRGGYRQVDIGDDVTVRYFPTKPEGGIAMRPVAAVAQPVNRSLPEPEKSGSPKLTP
jgi:hypothetical protein